MRLCSQPPTSPSFPVSLTSDLFLPRHAKHMTSLARYSDLRRERFFASYNERVRVRVQDLGTGWAAGAEARSQWRQRQRRSEL
ncbi:hypothetical protein BDZ91DRAFT_729341 [Kalaharituber pfeilii]|nr:hypothetical protein BDZ91DRAFT_729341 [Kalaharituber pfeilii]